MSKKKLKGDDVKRIMKKFSEDSINVKECVLQDNLYSSDSKGESSEKSEE
jgi:hypothetical protein